MAYTDIDFNDKKILITGGAGFIGSNLAFYFQENFPKCEIVVFDKFKSESSFGHFKNLLGFKGEVISGDINSDLALLKNNKFDYIFHQAAISDTTVGEQGLMIKTNVNAFKELLNMAVDMQASMIYASSAATYGDSEIFSIGYEKPNSVYGFSKLMMDNLAQKYMDKIPLVGLRYFNVYGQREFFKKKTASMVLQFGLQLLSGKSARLFENSDKIKRDFIYIEDVIQANIKACKAKKSGVYNIGTGEARSFQDIVDVLKCELHVSRDDEYIPNPFVGQYQFFTEADISLSEEFLDYSPRFSLEKGIKLYIDEIKRIYG